MFTFLIWLVVIYVLWKILPYVLGTIVGTVINASGKNPLYNTAKLLENVAIPVIASYEVNNYIKMKEMISLLTDCYYTQKYTEEDIIHIFSEKLVNESNYNHLKGLQRELVKHKAIYGSFLLKYAYNTLHTHSYSFKEHDVLNDLLNNIDFIKSLYKQYVIESSQP